MKTSLLLAGFLLMQVALGQDTKPRDEHEMHRLHQDPKAYLAMLDDPGRDEYQLPDKVIAALEIKPGEVIADIGAGSGYFTFRLAQQVGATGRVYAVDVGPEIILHLNRRIRDLKAHNVVSVLCDPEDPLLPEASIDRFFLCNTWHHIGDHARYLERLKKALKPGGSIVMIDFRKAKTPVGPPVQMRISRADLLQEMEANGFKLDSEQTFLPHQYFLVFVAR